MVQAAQQLPVSATVDHCNFAVHEIHALDASSSPFGGPQPWYEILVRPRRSVFLGSPRAFVDCLYRDRPPQFTDAEVMRRTADWLAGRNVQTRVSINTHPASLLCDQFIEQVLAHQAKLAPLAHSICLELIEFGDCTNKRVLIDNAQRLRSEGVLIALDDFGSRINCFDLCAAGIVDVLKIDTSVVSRLHLHRHQRAIVKSIRTLGDGLDARVVAEGVESAAELEILGMLGIDYAQGFYFHRPETVEI